jgi:molybdate/tungstate transport system ATP-binding protein
VIAARGVTARAGAFALHDVTFEIPHGCYAVVIGPAGAGKTTLLEVIAGLIRTTAGQLLLDGRDARAVPVEARDVGLVYQASWLFPHLSVSDNIHYAAADRATADEVVQRIDATPLLSRPVNTLSGGERQLVALARALARRPRLLLLDEPFSALDPRRRAAVRQAVRQLHRDWHLTTVHVTHDFGEAGFLGQRALLLDQGRIVQSGEPADVFRRPATPFAAEFLGAENVFAGHAEPDAGGVVVTSGPLRLRAVGATSAGPVHVVLRGEEIVLSRVEPEPSSARNRVAGTVTEVLPFGPVARVHIDVGGTVLIATVTMQSLAELALQPGAHVYATFKATSVHLC